MMLSYFGHISRTQVIIIVGHNTITDNLYRVVKNLENNTIYSKLLIIHKSSKVVSDTHTEQQ